MAEKRKVGRPATGRDPLLGVRVPVSIVAEVDAFAERHGISRSEAVRQALVALVKLGGLAPEMPAKAPKPPKATPVAEKPLKAASGRSAGLTVDVPYAGEFQRPRASPKGTKK